MHPNPSLQLLPLCKYPSTRSLNFPSFHAFSFPFSPLPLCLFPFSLLQWKLKVSIFRTRLTQCPLSQTHNSAQSRRQDRGLCSWGPVFWYSSTLMHSGSLKSVPLFRSLEKSYLAIFTPTSSPSFSWQIGPLSCSTQSSPSTNQMTHMQTKLPIGHIVLGAKVQTMHAP